MRGKRSLTRKTAAVLAAAMIAGCAGTACFAEESFAEESFAEPVQEETVTENTDTYDILLIGVDRRDESWYGNSDVNILVTVNNQKHTIYLTSFLRDLGVEIPGIGLRKLNAACANGGPELALETLSTCFDLDINNYAMVDFNSMRDIVDAVGGIDIELDDDEVVVANDYILTMCEANGDDFEEHKIACSGLVHLDGYQAVGYCRNRFTGSENDFGRTERQRKVIGAIADRLRDEGMLEAAATALKIMPALQSDIGPMDMFGLIGMAGSAISYEVKEQHIPYDGSYTVQDELLIVDMEETTRLLHETLYGA